jgi:Ca2+-binding RTX toxin-like protein
MLASTDQANDVFEGGLGFDTLSYADATDAITVDFAVGSASGPQVGADSFSGFEGLIGGSAGDTLRDGAGSHVIHGGAGDDLVAAAMDGANDIFEGGEGRDVLSYSSATGAITFDFVAGSVAGAEIGADTISGFEAVIGGKGDDTFLVGVTPLVLSGGGGNDTFTFGDLIAGLGEREAKKLVHEIDDLDVGDRIVYKSFELRRLSGDGDNGASSSTDTQDAFTAAYENDDDRRPFRFRNETRDNEERTFIEVIGDAAQPDDIQFTIDVRGYQRFEFYEHA